MLPRGRRARTYSKRNNAFVPILPLATRAIHTCKPPFLRTRGQRLLLRGLHNPLAQNVEVVPGLPLYAFCASALRVVALGRGARAQAPGAVNSPPESSQRVWAAAATI